ncbi:MAG: hypothetical protein V1921_00775 [Candidatus Altiarchaeota archaeon]
MKSTTYLVLLAVLAAGITVAQTMSSDVISDPVLAIVCGIYNAFRTIGVTIGGLVFLYAGVKYVTESDDPAARKQARDIMKIMVIGIGIILLADVTIYTVGGTALSNSCVPYIPT